MNSNRRNFLKQTGAFATFLIASGISPAILRRPIYAQGANNNLEMLVLGDSVTWGQGHSDESKFAFMLAIWLKTAKTGESRNVNLTMRAHSGAIIATSPEEFDSRRYRDRDTLKDYNGEVNISTPVIIDQAIQAAKHYRKIGIDPADVGLVLLNGGINDVGAARIVDPALSGDAEKLSHFARQHCYHSMKKLLQLTAGIYRNAVIAVPGYYPLFSEKSDCGPTADLLFAFFGVRRIDWIKKLCGKVETETPELVRQMREVLAKRSNVWYESSTCALESAIEEFNESENFFNPNLKRMANRVHFARIPFEDSNCFAAPDTFLWSYPNDPKAEVRKKAICESAINELYRRLSRSAPKRICEFASLFHPNIKGAELYAAELTKALEGQFG